MSRPLSENFPAYSAIVGAGIWLFFETFGELRMIDLLQIEAAFLVDYENFEQLNNSKRELQELSDNIKICFLDNKATL